MKNVTDAQTRALRALMREGRSFLPASKEGARIWGVHQHRTWIALETSGLIRIRRGKVKLKLKGGDQVEVDGAVMSVEITDMGEEAIA